MTFTYFLYDIFTIKFLSCVVSCRCSSGQDSTLHGLFDASWAILRASMRQYVDADDVLRPYLNLLQRYAEHQLSRLKSQSCMELYKTAYDVLDIYKKRFSHSSHTRNNNNNNSGGAASEEDEGGDQLFRNDACLSLLELLNHLSSKDFAFSEDCAEQINYSFEREVATVLLHGLEILLPIVTMDVIRNYPNISERFFSFCAFITASYAADIARWLNGLSAADNQYTLHELLLRLHCGSNVLEAATARQALQVINKFILFYSQYYGVNCLIVACG